MTRLFYRPMFAAIALFACLHGRAAAFVSSAEFPRMVQDADAVVRVRVKSVAAAAPDVGKFDVAELVVDRVVAGQCEHEVRVSFNEYHFEDKKDNGYEAGEIYYLCLKRDEEHPGFYREANFGYSKLPLKDGKVQAPVNFMPEGLKERIKDCLPDEFEGWVTWLRGPQIAIKPAAEKFRCDEPLAVKVTLTNTSPRPMELTVGMEEGFSAHFDATLSDASGFEVVGGGCCYGGRQDYQADSSFPSEKTSGKLTLKPGESTVGTARFYIRMDDFVENPELARTLAVRYSPRDSYSGWKTDLWGGAVSAKSAIAIDCPYGAWAAGLSQPGKSWRAYLDAPSLTIVPKQGMFVGVTLDRPSANTIYNFGAGGGSSLTTISEEDEKVLAGCFSLECANHAVAGPQLDAERVAAWLAKLDAKDRAFGFTINLAKYFALAPGVYSVRFALPGKEAVSNRLTFTVPKETKK